MAAADAERLAAQARPAPDEPAGAPAGSAEPPADDRPERPTARHAGPSVPPARDEGGPAAQRRALASRLSAGFVGSLATRASPSEIVRIASATATLPGLGTPRPSIPDTVVDDSTRARELVRELRAADLVALDEEGSRPLDPRPAPPGSPEDSADAPFLVRLAAQPAAALASVSDGWTLLAVARAGSLTQRRAALARIGALVAAGDPQAADAKEVAQLAGRDVDLEWDVERLLSRFPGQPGRGARASREAWRARFADLRTAIERYWDGAGSEPLAAAEGAELAGMAIHLREAPDEVVAHIGCAISGDDATVSSATRLELVATLRPSGDPRLLTSLAAIVEVGEPELLVPAARALARIDDPRVRPLLTSLYARPAGNAEKLVLAGALAMAGDLSGLPFVAQHAGSADADLAESALEALHALPDPTTLDVVTSQLRRPERSVVVASVRALGRVGDMRAIAPLAALRNETTSAAVRAEAEEALTTVRARLELRGEAVSETTEAALATVAAEPAKLDQEGARLSLRALWLQLVGMIWSILGATERAVRTFERCARAAPRWMRPLASAGFVLARSGEEARALAFFRRALEIDASAVTGDAIVMRALLRVALGRSDVLTRDGRREVARGVLDEVLALDLRRAPPEMSFEVARRARSLRDRPTLVASGRGGA